VLAEQTGYDLSAKCKITKLFLLCEAHFLSFEVKIMQIESMVAVRSLISLSCTISNAFENIPKYCQDLKYGYRSKAI